MVIFAWRISIRTGWSRATDRGGAAGSTGGGSVLEPTGASPCEMSAGAVAGGAEADCWACGVGRSLRARVARGEHRLVCGRGDGEANPHPRSPVTRHRTKDEEGTGFSGHEPDIGALPGREALLETAGRSVLERWWHGTDGDRSRIPNDFHRVGQVRILVLEMEDHVPSLRHRQHQAAAAESVEVHAAIGVGEARDQLELDGLTRRIRA